MKEKLLLYGFTDIFTEGAILSSLKSINPNTAIEVLKIDKKYYSSPIGYFAESNQPPAEAGIYKGEELSDRMIILCGLDSITTDIVLAALRGAGVGSETLKAMLTQVNKLWTPSVLLEELKRERAAFAQLNQR